MSNHKNYAELVNRLRTTESRSKSRLLEEAADAIEELVSARESKKPDAELLNLRRRVETQRLEIKRLQEELR